MTDENEDFDTEIEDDLEADEAEETVAEEDETPSASASERSWQRVAGRVALPALSVILAVTAVLLAWKSNSQQQTDSARTDSVASAREATQKILSYRAATVEQDLMAARDLLTGDFLNSYTDLIKNTVIPAAREKKISADARVQAAASITIDQPTAVVLVFIDQTVTMGGDPPTTTPSSVRVTLDNVDGRWLVSAFDPV